MGQDAVIGVYAFYNPDTKQAYVGSSKDLHYRQKKHLQELRSNRHANYKFQIAYNKNPNFVFMLFPMKTREEALAEEQKLIDQFYGKEFFLNISNDAYYCNVSQSQESIERMKAKLRLRKISPENLEKLRQANIGHRYNVGRKHTDEMRKKVSLANIGRKYIRSEEYREKQRIAHLGKLTSEETKRKLSLVNKGKKFPQEFSQKLHLGNLYRSKKVIIDGVKFDSLGQAARTLGVTTTTITNRITSGLYKAIHE